MPSCCLSVSSDSMQVAKISNAQYTQVMESLYICDRSNELLDRHRVWRLVQLEGPASLRPDARLFAALRDSTRNNVYLMCVRGW